MRIISLNAWGGQVWPALDGWVSTCGADILCLQEVTKPAQPSPPWLAYRDPFRNLNQRSNLFGDMSARLPQHQARFSAAAEGPLSDVGGKVYRSRHGLGQWVASDLTIAATGDGFVHGAFRRDGWGAEPVPRAFQAVRVSGPRLKRPLTVAHFHGLRDPSGKGDTDVRRAQAHKARALLSHIASSQDDVVLCGDFNVLPDSETLDLFKDWGLRDLVGSADTRTSLYTKPVRHANYMLVSPSVQVASFDAPAGPVVSDHRPLILTLK